jgi:spore cortex formation protein SpoVR/YcgB (stage V sporulation)
MINTMILENLFDNVLDQDTKGLLDDEINEIAREQGLDIYNDRDEILGIITNRIFELKYD